MAESIVHLDHRPMSAQSISPWRAILALSALAIVLMGPALVLGQPAIDSAAFNYVWTQQFGEALARGEIYPRWLPRSFEGIGSPAFYFYPPFAYYISGSFDQLGLDTPRAIGAAACVLLFASGCSMYAWLRGQTSRALLGAALYMAAPYHLADFYVRAALAEFSGFVWLPLIALAIQKQPRRWSTPLLAVSYAGLIFSHLPLTVLVTFALIGPYVLYRTWRERDVAIAGASLLAGVTAIALAGIYLLPALTLQKHLSTAVLFGPLYRPSAWNILAPAADIPTPFLYTMATLAIAAALLAITTGRNLWSIIAAVTALLSLGLPPLFWNLPIIAEVQFPWRIMAIVEFCAVTALVLHPPRRRLIVGLASVIAAAAVFRLGAATVEAFGNAYPADIETAMPEPPEYLPPSFHAPGVENYQFRPDLGGLRGPLVSGPVTSVSQQRDGRLQLRVSRPGQVEVRKASFPVWRVETRGRAVALQPAPMLRFNASPGDYVVRRVMLPSEMIGSVAGVAGLALLGGLLFWARRSRQDARRPLG